MSPLAPSLPRSLLLFAACAQLESSDSLPCVQPLTCAQLGHVEAGRSGWSNEHTRSEGGRGGQRKAREGRAALRPLLHRARAHSLPRASSLVFNCCSFHPLPHLMCACEVPSRFMAGRGGGRRRRCEAASPLLSSPLSSRLSSDWARWRHSARPPPRPLAAAAAAAAAHSNDHTAIIEAGKRG